MGFFPERYMTLSLKLILSFIFILFLSIFGKKKLNAGESSFSLVVVFYIFSGFLLSFGFKEELRLLSPFFLLCLGIVGFLEGASINFSRLELKRGIKLPVLKFVLFFSYFFLAFFLISKSFMLSLSVSTLLTPISIRISSIKIRLLASLWEIFSILILGVIFSLERGNFLASLALHILFGVLLALITYISLGIKASSAERNAIIIGILFLGASSASFLLLSPIFVGFIAGLIYANLPRFTGVENLLPELLNLEKPAFLFLLISLGIFSSALGIVSLLLAGLFFALKIPPAALSREASFILIPPVSVAMALSLFFHFPALFSSQILTAFTVSLIFSEIIMFILLNYSGKCNIIVKRGR